MPPSICVGICASMGVEGAFQKHFGHIDFHPISLLVNACTVRIVMASFDFRTTYGECHLL